MHEDKKKLNLQTLVQKTLNTLNFEEYFLKSSGRWCKQSENRNENSLKIFYSRVENLTANYPMAKNRSFWYGPRSVSGGHRIIFCHQHTDNHFSWDYSESLLAFINTRLFRFNFSWQNFPNRTHTHKWYPFAVAATTTERKILIKLVLTEATMNRNGTKRWSRELLMTWPTFGR